MSRVNKLPGVVQSKHNDAFAARLIVAIDGDAHARHGGLDPVTINPKHHQWPPAMNPAVSLPHHAEAKSDPIIPQPCQRRTQNIDDYRCQVRGDGVESRQLMATRSRATDGRPQWMTGMMRHRRRPEEGKCPVCFSLPAWTKWSSRCPCAPLSPRTLGPNPSDFGDLLPLDPLSAMPPVNPRTKVVMAMGEGPITAIHHTSHTLSCPTPSPSVDVGRVAALAPSSHTLYSRVLNRARVRASTPHLTVPGNGLAAWGLGNTRHPQQEKPNKALPLPDPPGRPPPTTSPASQAQAAWSWLVEQSSGSELSAKPACTHIRVGPRPESPVLPPTSSSTGQRSIAQHRGSIFSSCISIAATGERRASAPRNTPQRPQP
ncbi:hypothetical protein G7046_g9413 [Stylonectria norvegica]|nr:hypothetical protein G7046_g9413 [Stylonectria norvegica]